MMGRSDYSLLGGNPANVAYEIGSGRTQGTGFNEAALAGSMMIVSGAVAIPALGIRMSMLMGNPYWIMYGWYRSPILKTAKYLGVRGASALYGASRVYASGKLGAAIANPLQTYHLVRTGQYDRAVVNFYGPIGSLLIYDRLREHYGRSSTGSNYYDLVAESDTPSATKDTPVVSTKSRRRGRRKSGRKGRYCRKHKKYDWCYKRTK